MRHGRPSFFSRRSFSRRSYHNLTAVTIAFFDSGHCLFTKSRQPLITEVRRVKPDIDADVVALT